MSTTHVVGTVAELWRYPVKSMRGEPLSAADLTVHGLAGDRRHAFVRSRNRSSFPWLTGRQVPDMLRYVPRQADGATGRVEVTTPAGDIHDVTDPALCEDLAAAAGEPVHLLQLNRGAFDETSVSLIGTASVRALGRALGDPLEVRRFRQNLVLDVGERPFAEEGWAGGTLEVGQARIAVVQPIPRCRMITLDPDTVERDARVLDLVHDTREGCAGMHGWPVVQGRIEVGDEVRLVAG